MLLANKLGVRKPDRPSRENIRLDTEIVRLLSELLRLFD
jgi:hypothetical protein